MDIIKSDPKPKTAYSVFYPLLLLVITVFLNQVFQTYQLHEKKNNLILINQGLNESFENSRKLRTQFNTITTDTAVLASQGNQNAKLIIQQLKKSGIKVMPTF